MRVCVCACACVSARLLPCSCFCFTVLSFSFPSLFFFSSFPSFVSALTHFLCLSSSSRPPPPPQPPPLQLAFAVAHDVQAKFLKTKVYMQPAKPGAGIKAHPLIEIMCNLVGIQDMTADVFGSKNPLNVVRAAMEVSERFFFLFLCAANTAWHFSNTLLLSLTHTYTLARTCSPLFFVLASAGVQGTTGSS